MFALHNGRGPECDFFRSFSEKGYAGGTQGSRQGIYCIAPTGELLGSDNTRDPGRALRLMKASLERWEQMPKSRRLRDQAPDADPAGRQRGEKHFPKDGLVLRMYTRDLGPQKRAMGDLTNPFNMDAVWFTAEEARQLLPAQPRQGERHSVPDHLIRRLARLHLVDCVLGLARPFPEGAVSEAVLRSEVVAVNGSLITLALAGATKAADQGREMETDLRGRATYDLGNKRFSAFELVASGNRRGITTRVPYILNDTGSGAIGFVFTLVSSSEPQDKVAPFLLGAYGWR